MGNKEEFEAVVKDIRAVMEKRETICPATVLEGEYSLRCTRELGHDGDHLGMYTPHNAYVRRIAERVSENLCVHDGAIAWKCTDANPIQGWDDSIKILEELIRVVMRIEREGPQPGTYFHRSDNKPS